MYYKENCYWGSALNDREDVRRAGVPDHPVIIHDCTLRDGEQTPGVVFTPEDKILIADKLVAAGITRIEAGMPAVSAEDYRAVKEIAAKYPQAEIYAFARAMRRDLDMAKETGCKGVVIEVPIGYPKLKYQFHWTWEPVLAKSIDCIQYARELGLRTVYFPYDTTRAKDGDLENLLNGLAAADAVPDAIGIVDTMGCALPQTIQYLVRKTKELLGDQIVVEVHCHNDFGMAVANEIAGALAGAEVVHGCINGLGERTGNAAIEEIILQFNLLMGMDTPYDETKLTDLCETVERISGVRCAPNKPFVGVRNYTRESGIGVDLVIKEPLAMFATNPAYFGKKADVVLGKKSGKASIAYMLEQEHLESTEEQAAEMLLRVKQKGIAERRLVTREEFLGIAKEVLGE